jgi:hypothetical protein
MGAGVLRVGHVGAADPFGSAGGSAPDPGRDPRRGFPIILGGCVGGAAPFQESGAVVHSMEADCLRRWPAGPAGPEPADRAAGVVAGEAADPSSSAQAAHLGRWCRIRLTSSSTVAPPQTSSGGPVFNIATRALLAVDGKGRGGSADKARCWGLLGHVLQSRPGCRVRFRWCRSPCWDAAPLWKPPGRGLPGDTREESGRNPQGAAPTQNRVGGLKFDIRVASPLDRWWPACWTNAGAAVPACAASAITRLSAQLRRLVGRGQRAPSRHHQRPHERDQGGGWWARQRHGRGRLVQWSFTTAT